MYLKGENQSIDENWKVGILPKDIDDKNERKVMVIVVQKILPVIKLQ